MSKPARRAVKKGDKVRIVLGHNADQIGTIRFIGATKFASGKWLGVELDTKDGKNDGSVQGERYFQCKPGYGLFVKPSMVRPAGSGKSSTPSSRRSAKSPAARSTPKTRQKTTPQTAPASSTHRTPSATRRPAGSSSPMKRSATTSEMTREERKAAKKQEIDNSIMQKELDRVKSELIDTKAKLKKVQQNLMEVKKSEISATTQVSKLETKVAELNESVENATLEKEIAEQTAEELKDEMELLKDSVKNAQLEVEMAKQKQEASAQELMKELPANQQESAKLVQQNKSLTDALRQIRDLAMSEKQRFEMYQEQSKRTIARLQEDSKNLRDREKELAKAKEDIEDLKASLDEAEEHGAMVEDLTEKNIELSEAIEELKSQVATLTELNDAADEVEETHQEYEAQLQEDLKIATKQVSQLQDQLKVAETKMKDMQHSIRQYRTLTQELQSNQDIATTAGAGNSEAKSAAAAQATRQFKLAQQVHEFRAQSVEYSLYKLEAEQARQQVAFVKAYIPDNMKIDVTSLNMLSLLERIKFKAELNCELVNKFYGPGVAVLEGSEAGKVADLACVASLSLVDLHSAVHTLQHCLRTADAQNYGMVSGRYSQLASTEAILDEFLQKIAKDTITEETKVSALDQAVGIIRKFVQSFFHSDDSPAPSDELPSADTDDYLWLSCRKLHYQQARARVKCRVLGAVVMSVETGANNDSDISTLPLHHQLFNAIEDAQIHANGVVEGLVKQAFALVESRGYVPMDSIKKQLKVVEELSNQTALVIGNLLLEARSAVASSPDNATAADRLAGIFQKHSTADDKDGTTHHLKELTEQVTTLQLALKDRLEVAKRTKPDDKHSTTVTVWDRHAAGVRKELMEAAGLRTKLEETQRVMQAKVDSLFAANKKARQAQSKIDVLNQRLKLVESKAGSTDELKEELDKLRRQDQEYQDSMNQVQRDLDKYSAENQALKKKITSLAKRKIGSGREVHGRAASNVVGYITGDAAAEVNLLAQTVRTLRNQLASVRVHQSSMKVLESLPPLPSINAPNIHPAGHHSYGDQLAHVARRERLPASVPVTEKISRLSQGLGKTSQSLLKLRAEPALVDLAAANGSNRVASSSLWARQQARQRRLLVDSQKLKRRFMALSKVAAHQASAVRPGLPAAVSKAKLVGAVKIPSGSQQNITAELEVGREHMRQLLRAFV